MWRMAANKESKNLEDKKKTVLRALIKLPADSEDIAHPSDFSLWFLTTLPTINSSNAVCFLSLKKSLKPVSQKYQVTASQQLLF